MSAAFALLLAAAAQTAPADRQAQPEHGAQFDTAQISATIVHPAIVQGGVLVSNGAAGQPHSQTVRSTGRVTYLFE